MDEFDRANGRLQSLEREKVILWSPLPPKPTAIYVSFWILWHCDIFLDKLPLVILPFIFLFGFYDIVMSFWTNYLWSYYLFIREKVYSYIFEVWFFLHTCNIVGVAYLDAYFLPIFDISFIFLASSWNGLSLWENSFEFLEKDLTGCLNQDSGLICHIILCIQSLW